MELSPCNLQCVAMIELFKFERPGNQGLAGLTVIVTLMRANDVMTKCQGTHACVAAVR